MTSPHKKSLSQSKSASCSIEQFSPSEQCELCHQAINTMCDEVMLLEKDGRIAFVNEAAVRGTGYSGKLLTRKHITQILNGRKNMGQWWGKYFRELKQNKFPVAVHMNRTIKGGKKQTIELIGVYFEFRGIDYILIVTRDITEQSRYQNLVEESKRIEMLFNFVSGMAQEVNAPLQSIQKHTRRLLSAYKNRDFEYISYKEFQDIFNTIKQMSDQVNYCCATVSRLLSLNKRRLKAHKRNCDVNKVVKDVSALLSQQFSMFDVKIQFRLGKNLPEAAIGPIELQQVVSNISTNSLQAMVAGGILKIRTIFRPNTNTLEIRFEDQGIGIDRENINRIFEPFFTTKQRGIEKSSGLGLSIVYSIVKSCRGNVTIKSSLRQGTIVIVNIPIVKKKT